MTGCGGYGRHEAAGNGKAIRAPDQAQRLKGGWFICVNGQRHASAALPTAFIGWGAERARSMSGHCGRLSRIALLLSSQTRGDGRGM
jgi:hypothetical protein